MSVPAILAPRIRLEPYAPAHFFHLGAWLQDESSILEGASRIAKSSFAPSALGREAKSWGVLSLSLRRPPYFLEPRKLEKNGQHSVPRGAPLAGVVRGFGAAPFTGRLPGPQPCAKLHRWLVVTDDRPIKPCISRAPPQLRWTPCLGTRASPTREFIGPRLWQECP